MSPPQWDWGRDVIPPLMRDGKKEYQLNEGCDAPPLNGIEEMMYPPKRDVGRRCVPQMEGVKDV